MRYRLLIVALLTCSGCAHDASWRANHPPRHKSDVQLASFSAESSDQVARTIYVMSNGFHTGLVFNRYDVPEEAWPEIRQIPDHDWVEVGWGSEIFYRAKKNTAPVVLGAVVPNPSVLHVVGFDRNPEELYAEMDLIRIDLTSDEVAAICRRIHDTYECDADGEVQNLGPGIYADGFFFRARGNYYFPKTCNVWTARCLQSSGMPITPEVCGAADAVLMTVRKFGETIHRRGEHNK